MSTRRCALLLHSAASVGVCVCVTVSQACSVVSVPAGVVDCTTGCVWRQQTARRTGIPHSDLLTSHVLCSMATLQ